VFLCSGELQDIVSCIQRGTAGTASPEQHSHGCNSTAPVIPTYPTSSGNTTPNEFCYIFSCTMKLRYIYFSFLSCKTTLAVHNVAINNTAWSHQGAVIAWAAIFRWRCHWAVLEWPWGVVIFITLNSNTGGGGKINCEEDVAVETSRWAVLSVSVFYSLR
jgi:hypothetical protein